MIRARWDLGKSQALLVGWGTTAAPTRPAEGISEIMLLAGKQHLACRVRP